MTERQSNIWHIPEGWEVKKLKDVITNAGDYGANAPAKPYIEGDTRYIRITDIDDYGNLIPDDKVSIDESVAQNYLLEDNDMLFARTGDTVGKSLLYKSTMGKAAYAGYLIKFSFDRTKIFPEYFNAIAKSDILEAFKNSMKRVGAKPNINSREYGTFTFPLPINLQEQKNIAAILSKVDEAIASVQASISAAERLKKSLMQNLLTGRMKPDGTLRKDDEFYVDEKFGRVPKGWVVKAIGNKSVCQINPVYKYKKKEVYDFVPMEAVRENFGGLDFVEKQIIDNGSFTRFKAGDILFAKITPCSENGKVTYIDHIDSEIGFASTEFIVFHPTENVNGRFIYLILSSGNVHRLAISLMEGTTGRQRIPWKIFRNRIFVPMPDKEEQTEIVNRILAFDKKIKENNNKIAVLERLKKSLMQNLLTGRVRINKQS